MILTCNKCGKSLTTDLYLISNKKYNKNNVYSNRRMLKGLFYISKRISKENFKYKQGVPAQIIKQQPSKIVVGEGSILEGIIPPFEKGHGCCNWSFGRHLHCECGECLGEMYLDCYEGGEVEFYKNSVRRLYL